jgi:hypothetical protein
MDIVEQIPAALAQVLDEKAPDRLRVGDAIDQVT